MSIICRCNLWWRESIYSDCVSLLIRPNFFSFYTCSQFILVIFIIAQTHSTHKIILSIFIRKKRIIFFEYSVSSSINCRWLLSSFFLLLIFFFMLLHFFFILFHFISNLFPSLLSINYYHFNVFAYNFTLNIISSILIFNTILLLCNEKKFVRIITNWFFFGFNLDLLLYCVIVLLIFTISPIWCVKSNKNKKLEVIRQIWYENKQMRICKTNWIKKICTEETP